YLELNAGYKAAKVLQLIEQKCAIRSGSVGGQKFILVMNPDNAWVFSIVPQDLNLITLGLLQAPKPVIITALEDNQQQYLQLFDQFWNNSPLDLKSQVLQMVQKAAVNYAPDLLYKFSLHHIFADAIFDEASEQRLSRIGFKQTATWNMLYN